MSFVGIMIVVLGIGLSIALHEVGHMLPAKRFGVKVTQFMVGFGPSIFSRKKGDTEYGIKAIPLGGYIRMIGMFPPRSTEAKQSGRMRRIIEDARASTLAEVDPADEHRVFWRLKTWQKIVVMAGGPTVNLVLAVLFLSLASYGIGFPQFSTAVREVVACVPTQANPQGAASGTDGTACIGTKPTPATLMGLRAGDRIIAINGVAYPNWDQMTTALEDLRSAPIAVTVKRAGETLTLRGTTATLPAVARDVSGNPTGKTTTRGFVGFAPAIEYVSAAGFDVPRSLWNMTTQSVKALGSFPVKIYDLGKSLVTNQPRDIYGPVSVVGVVNIGGQMTADGVPWRESALNLLGLLASLNLFLFLFNLIPLPPLDGGHVAGAVWEGIRRRWARMSGRANPGPVDTAAMLPIAYVAASVLLLMSLVVIVADIIKPVHLPG